MFRWEWRDRRHGRGAIHVCFGAGVNVAAGAGRAGVCASSTPGMIGRSGRSRPCRRCAERRSEVSVRVSGRPFACFGGKARGRWQREVRNEVHHLRAAIAGWRGELAPPHRFSQQGGRLERPGAILPRRGRMKKALQRPSQRASFSGFRVSGGDQRTARRLRIRPMPAMAMRPSVAGSGAIAFGAQAAPAARFPLSFSGT